MTLIQLYDKGLTPFQQLLGYNKGIQLHWQQLGMYSKRRASIRFIKRRGSKNFSSKNGCQYCLAKGKPDPQNYDEKTAVCTGFAEAFLAAKGHTAPNVTAVLKDYLTEAEISELLAFICFTTAQQYFGALMQLK